MTGPFSRTKFLLITPEGFIEISFSNDNMLELCSLKKRKEDASTKLITTLFSVIYLLRCFNFNFLHFVL